MSTNSKRLALSQLDNTLSRFCPVRDAVAPKKGWIRAIRSALGMSAKQLGKRASMSQAAVTQIEKGEAEGTTTLSTIRKMAKALDCTFVYALVPNTSLEAFVERQTRGVARRQLSSTSNSMALETQTVTDEQTRKQIELLVDELLITRPRHIWNQDGS